MRREVELAALVVVAVGQKLERCVTLDAPGKAPEIVAVDSAGERLVYNDAAAKAMHVVAVTWTEGKPAVELVREVKFATEPTSVALHPSERVAFVVTLGGEPHARGELRAIDLREGKVGEERWTQPLGRHPDSVKVSPDGRWVVSADEGQDSDSDEHSPGAVSVVELGGDVFADSAREKTELNVADVVNDVRAGVIEPEFVAFDPRSRFAVVTCQENDLAVVVDLRGEKPRLSNTVLRLPEGAEPDGVSVLADVEVDGLGRGALVALAEEGREVKGERRGQSFSLHWLGPEPSFERVVELSRVNIATLLEAKKGRADPEAVVLVRRGERLFAAVAAERCDAVALFDVTDPRAPVHAGSAPTGVRPEGLAAFERKGELWFVSGDEGLDGGGPGELTFLRWVD